MNSKNLHCWFHDPVKKQANNTFMTTAVFTFRIFLPIFFLLTVCSLISCELDFPTFQKSDLPAGHTENNRGALHKADSERPFSQNSGCSSNNCHQSDLKGGIAEIEGEQQIAPSCYQCHGRQWDCRSKNDWNNSRCGDWMKFSLIIRILITFAAFIALWGCAVVQPWERQELSDPIMILDENPLDKAVMEHHREYREGTKGGTGARGGGCGCG